jgi:hypothetical protein
MVARQNVLDGAFRIASSGRTARAEQPHAQLAAGRVSHDRYAHARLPIASGETWSTRLHGVGLPDCECDSLTAAPARHFRNAQSGRRRAATILL